MLLESTHISYQNRDPRDNDKTVQWLSYLFHGNPHTGKDRFCFETESCLLYLMYSPIQDPYMCITSPPAASQDAGRLTSWYMHRSHNSWLEPYSNSLQPSTFHSTDFSLPNCKLQRVIMIHTIRFYDWGDRSIPVMPSPCRRLYQQ